MYFSWDEKTIQDFSDKNINNLYNQGYIFTRVGKGVMKQTRSVRIDLEKFELSSENRRVLRKTENLEMIKEPLPYKNYHWSIHKTGKDFYEQKFGPKIFSAQKIKEVMSDPAKSNFNAVFVFSRNKKNIGYCVALETDEVIHYSYPFYDLEKSPKDMGMGMMIRAVEYAKQQGKKYIYLGSAQRASDTYKLQFKGLEWFDGNEWKNDLEELKEILKNS